MKHILLIGVLVFFIMACSNKKKLATTQKEPTTNNTVVSDTKSDDKVFDIQIIRISCASTVALIMDPKYYELGEPEWVPYNVRMKTPYKNVVSIFNKCAIPNKVKEGDTIKVKLITADEANKIPCEVCLLIDFPPAKGINIKFIK